MHAWTRSFALFTIAALLLMAPDLMVRDAHAQDRSNMLPRTSPNASVSQTIGVTEVHVTYGRPSVNGRTIFGDLVAYDEIWRTGANEATTITFSSPVMVEGEALSAGTYGLFTIPGESSWTIVFNEEPEQWGAYNYDESKDALRVEVEPQPSDMTEMMTFSFRDVSDTEATLVMEWAEMEVPIDVSVNTQEIIAQDAGTQIQETDDWRVPVRYAAYALQNDVMIEQAMTWVEASIEMQENFQNLNVKARLQAASGNHGAAVSTAEKALSMAESMDEEPRGASDLRQKVDEWKSQG
jgi:hypothetical protein